MMRIGHQLFEFLEFFTDTGSYRVDDVQFFTDAQGSRLCIVEIYINYDERQVYLIVEDENHNSFHVTINGFIKLMGGPKYESYRPLYEIRNETKKIKKNGIRRFNRTLRKFDPEFKNGIKKMFKKLLKDENN